MAEKEYIERASIYIAVKRHTKPTLDYESGVKVLEMIKQEPAADVVEVVHAEWQERCVDGYWHYGCPVCGYGYSTEWRDVTLPNHCQNCGAKMDRERKDQK